MHSDSDSGKKKKKDTYVVMSETHVVLTLKSRCNELRVDRFQPLTLMRTLILESD